MNLIQLKPRPSIDLISTKKYNALQSYLNALSAMQLPDEFVSYANGKIERLNALSDSDPILRKEIRKLQSTLSNSALKQLKIVPQNYYLTLGMSVGMAALGIPFGLMFSLALDSFAFIGIGLPIGLGIGLAIGTGLDKKAEAEGRQLKTVSV
ncbi:hypothetical protein [Ekhidna sp.]|uniref:hypothetical protein n=1 Tax=Ekhidna sp. TaxID=2608089 RepID=UPI003CCBB9D4